jgi:hypothetical protein
MLAAEDKTCDQAPKHAAYACSHSVAGDGADIVTLDIPGPIQMRAAHVFCCLGQHHCGNEDSGENACPAAAGKAHCKGPLPGAVGRRAQASFGMPMAGGTATAALVDRRCVRVNEAADNAFVYYKMLRKICGFAPCGETQLLVTSSLKELIDQ